MCSLTRVTCVLLHSLQEAQQEAYFNAGPFGGDLPSPQTNRWYPDLGQNMQGT